jgi:membrane protein DedA with SNARE-associated domain
MLEVIFDILRELGWAGLIAGIAVEALSIPFPAAIIFLIYGYLIGPSGWDIVWISLLASAAYTIIAYIPYYLSLRFQGFVQRRLVSKRAKRMVRFMEKYREWTIAAGRVLGMGYIVYVAAFCRITPLRYGVFTFIGVFPVAVVMLYLGTLGVVGEAYGVFQNVQYLIAGLFAAAVVYYIYFRMKSKKKTENVPSRAR